MDYKERISNYDKEPEVIIKGFENKVWTGYEQIINEIKSKIDKKKYILTLDCYPGVRDEEVMSAFINGLNPSCVIKSEDVFYDGENITNLIEKNLTDDRVFGMMYYGEIDDFINKEKLNEAKEKLEEIEEGIVIVYGVAASKIAKGDTLIYLDLARWEIQQRYRKKELGNYKIKNLEEDTLKKYKRAFFIEWRVADRHKKELYDGIEYLLDTNIYDNPKMVSGDGFRAGLIEATKRPFRVVPYFDTGIWGGQWMKEVCDLDRSKENFAWCFDGVPEENSLFLRYGEVRIEVPSLNVVLYRPKELLGEKVYDRFGAEFPIRFDFLDTIEGGNLSLQVHPVTQYMQENFGMKYTQDESYYILDAKEDACVYLGVKDGIEKDEMINDLQRAENGEISFDAEKYINKFPAEKHDHFLIPAGTIHCSGKNSMVLEISATPYIFTFKLWDWGRLGLDGIPRPIHVNHGKNVIDWDRRTEWVKNNLVNKIELIKDDGKVKEEKTGLHELEFIETRRIWFSEKTLFDTDKGVNVLNLIEGDEAVVESVDNTFEPFIVHYAETFIMPANVSKYTITPIGKSVGKKIAVIKAYVRF
ncbi:class I mannose-6-phosphate isomerase [Clostridium gasigenes]|uniref:Mannose-6-phosphate isomerase, class I n=1 Tax=Clostridium gasigenes TaxID=94869 RepID=A0A1H0VMX9_9CLOT|nr:class I mannose-6-phosphate isomerase [Clostridium gasigenes]MBU3089596.1 class I mannose-6-phosphate isomerase [Clostridium gasigenes]SDP79959.1 Mannose-6-phosphate isomerase, class I [Clostridium gasigenes]